MSPASLSAGTLHFMGGYLACFQINMSKIQNSSQFKHLFTRACIAYTGAANTSPFACVLNYFSNFLGILLGLASILWSCRYQ